MSNHQASIAATSASHVDNQQTNETLLLSSDGNMISLSNFWWSMENGLCGCYGEQQHEAACCLLEGVDRPVRIDSVLTNIRSLDIDDNNNLRISTNEDFIRSRKMMIQSCQTSSIVDFEDDLSDMDHPHNLKNDIWKHDKNTKENDSDSELELCISYSWDEDDCDD
jgi:hypothetical protein